MQLIPTKVHGALDYLSGLLLIASPWLFNFANGSFAQWVPIIVGVAILLASLITDYELSVAKVLPMRTHLALDVLSGATLAASPWLFGFAEWVFWPHVLLGIAEIGAGLFTQRVPSYRQAVPAPEVDQPKVSSTRDPQQKPEHRSYQPGDVIEVSDNRTDTEAQRHMQNDEELETHVREQQRQRAADTDRSRRTRNGEHSPQRHDG